MSKEEIEPLESFLERLCFSFSTGIGNLKPLKVEFYNSTSWILDIVQERTYAHLINGPTFSLRESRAFPELELNRYYIDVGYFMDLYERKKANGENARV